MVNVREQDAADAAVMEAAKTVAEAQAAKAREEQRLEEARGDVERHSRQIEETDPDDEKAFVRLVAARDAARGRVEALEVRVRKAAANLANAERAETAAKAAGSARRLAYLNEETRRRDDAITARLLALADEVSTEILSLRELVLEANRLTFPASDPLLRSDRGLRWPFQEFRSVFRHAAGIPIDELAQFQREKARRS